MILLLAAVLCAAPLDATPLPGFRLEIAGRIEIGVAKTGSATRSVVFEQEGTNETANIHTVDETNKTLARCPADWFANVWVCGNDAIVDVASDGGAARWAMRTSQVGAPAET